MTALVLSIVCLATAIGLAAGAAAYQGHQREVEYRRVCAWWGGVPAHDGQKFLCFTPRRNNP